MTILTDTQKERMKKNREEALRRQAQRKATEELKLSKSSSPSSSPLKIQGNSINNDNILIHTIKTSSFSSSLPTFEDSTPNSLLPIDFNLERVCQHEDIIDINDKNTIIKCCSAEIDESMFTTFGERICKRCRLKSTQWEFINKSKASKEYLLPDSTIQAMKFTTKVNPHHSSWQPMKLYLKKHVEELALWRWKSFEALEKELGKRKAESYERMKQKDACGEIMQFRSMTEVTGNNINNDHHNLFDGDNNNNKNKNNNSLENCASEIISDVKIPTTSTTINNNNYNNNFNNYNNCKGKDGESSKSSNENNIQQNKNNKVSNYDPNDPRTLVLQMRAGRQRGKRVMNDNDNNNGNEKEIQVSKKTKRRKKLAGLVAAVTGD